MKTLYLGCTFKGVEYHGRVVINKEDEGLVMFEEKLGDVLSPFVCGEEECDKETWKRVCDIDDEIWCYVPKDVLQRSDEEVIKWCIEHSIDV